MAGSWIRMRHDLIDAPEIRRLSRACGVTKDDVLGKLFRLWSWFDRHSVNGVVADEELDAVDELIGLDGFAAALVSVGWLAPNAVGIVIPNWDRHNSESAKERALAAVRQERTRAKPLEINLSRCERDGHVDGCHAETVTREEKTRSSPLHAREAWEAIRAAWHATGKLKPWKPDRPPKQNAGTLDDAGWCEDAIAAIERLPACRFFKTPPTMLQLFSPGFVDKVLAGTFDEQPGRERGGDFGGAPPPPREWDPKTRAALERTRKMVEAKRQEAAT